MCQLINLRCEALKHDEIVRKQTFYIFRVDNKIGGKKPNLLVGIGVFKPNIKQVARIRPGYIQ